MGPVKGVGFQGWDLVSTFRGKRYFPLCKCPGLQDHTCGSPRCNTAGAVISFGTRTEVPKCKITPFLSSFSEFIFGFTLCDIRSVLDTSLGCPVSRVTTTPPSSREWDLLLGPRVPPPKSTPPTRTVSVFHFTPCAHPRPSKPPADHSLRPDLEGPVPPDPITHNRTPG